MNVDTELQDYEAAGSLAEELPYWGWLDDERTCLTRAGELMSMARVSPSRHFSPMGPEKAALFGIKCFE